MPPYATKRWKAPFTYVILVSKGSHGGTCLKSKYLGVRGRKVKASLDYSKHTSHFKIIKVTANLTFLDQFG